MKSLHQISNPIKKFFKGMLVILTLNLFVVFSIFLFDSCKKTVYEKSDSKHANAKFMSVLEHTKNSIASIILPKQNIQNNITRPLAPVTHELVTYINFPSEVTPETYNLFQNVNSVQAISDLIHQTNAIVEYDATPKNSNYKIIVPIETVINKLTPLVQESKLYLYAKGFTEQDIQQMILEENATEQDLIPFVISLKQIENIQSSQIARNYSNFFVKSANAGTNPYVECALAAIGADAIWAIGGTSASSWSKAAMKIAFKKIAPRFLGPWGVAIAIISFGICMSQK